MVVAFPCWQQRLAPLFDTVGEVMLIDTNDGDVARPTSAPLPAGAPLHKVLALVGLGVGTLVCGAISRPLHEMITAYGIEVIPFVVGDLQEVIRAWRDGRLEQDAFVMPGCRGRRRGRRGRCRHGERKARRCQAEIEQDRSEQER